MEGQLNWKSDNYLLRHPIQRSDLIDGIDNSIKAKNKMSAALNMSAPGAHNLQSLTTLQVRVESSRETTYVFYLENLPRDTSYVSSSSSRIVVRVHLYLENHRTSLPREQPRELAGARDRESPEAAEPQKGQEK